MFIATSMLGFAAGAGIAVRNSVILVDFLDLRIRHGRTLAEEIFRGLAISLLGAIASLLISPCAVPLIYLHGSRGPTGPRQTFRR